MGGDDKGLIALASFFWEVSGCFNGLYLRSKMLWYFKPGILQCYMYVIGMLYWSDPISWRTGHCSQSS